MIFFRRRRIKPSKSCPRWRTTKRCVQNVRAVRNQNLFLFVVLTAVFAITIILQVARLYRNSLKTLLSWAVDRDIFNEKATELRARFDSSRGVSPSAAARLLRVRNLLISLCRCGCCMIARVLFLLYTCNSDLFSLCLIDWRCFVVFCCSSFCINLACFIYFTIFTGRRRWIV